MYGKIIPDNSFDNETTLVSEKRPGQIFVHYRKKVISSASGRYDRIITTKKAPDYSAENLYFWDAGRNFKL